ncbi:MAG: hypothetical protein JSR24_18045 [Proteobacteria bacterium]|nr:hypothetical protein [Pseudomonadota bacterium]
MFQQILVSAGAAVFLFLGLLHAALTLRDLGTPRAFAPRDPALLQAMQQARVRLHPGINLWKAWMGFNLTHSLGLVLFGGVLLYVGLCAPQLFAASAAVQAVAVLVSVLYLVISAKFFFRTPVIGCALGLGCFLAAMGAGLF